MDWGQIANGDTYIAEFLARKSKFLSLDRLLHGACEEITDEDIIIVVLDADNPRAKSQLEALRDKSGCTVFTVPSVSSAAFRCAAALAVHLVDAVNTAVVTCIGEQMGGLMEATFDLGDCKYRKAMRDASN